ncbi:MAG: PHP-associated domain-containing protein [Persicimonas sp.]
MLVDMHAKSALSRGVSLTARQVLERARATGLEGVAFCETMSTALCEETVALGRELDISVFIGVEIPTDRGILLGFVPEIGEFYLGEEWRRLADVTAPPAEAILDLFEGRGGAVIAARPYDLDIPFNMGDHIFTFDKLTAVEVFNSRIENLQQDFAMEAASFMDLSTVGGSDPTDSLEDIGRYATYFEEELTTQADLVDALRTAEYWSVALGDARKKTA